MIFDTKMHSQAKFNLLELMKKELAKIYHRRTFIWQEQTYDSLVRIGGSSE